MTVLLFVATGQAIVTTALTGLVWFVQVVHYPLFASVGTKSSASYAHEHIRRTTRLVAPLMVAELTMALLMAMVSEGTLQVLAVLGLLLVAAIWISTFTVQVPCHARLVGSFEPVARRKLVRTNWARTILWTCRSLLVFWMLLEITIP